MAQFNEAYKILTKAEFSNKESKFVHRNENENGLTVGGVYQKAHPNVLDWDFIYAIVQVCQSISRASTMLYHDDQIQLQVYTFFKTEFWDKARLSEVHSQKIANEIFLFGVHVGLSNAIEMAQKQVGAKQDGILGNLTLKALNNYNENRFDTKFDQLENEYYIELINKRPDLEYARNGFKARSELV